MAMQRLIGRLMGSLGEIFGWRRALIVVQDETGAVAWSVTPTDMELSVRVNTDHSLSVTLGHRDPGDGFLAELETLLEIRSANQGANGARTGAQAVEAVAGKAAASTG
jgi:hypothetical protein